MEQNDSLKLYLEQIAMMQQQQLQILADMNNKQAVENTIQQQQLTAINENTDFQPQQVNFNPSAYSNYTSSYMPPMVPLSPAAQQQVQRFGAYAQQVINPQDKYGFFDSIMPSQSRVSRQTGTLLAMDYGSRVAQAGVVATSAAIGTASSWALASILPGIFGFGSSILGGALVGGAVDIGLKEMKKQSAYEQFLMRESYRFINPNESNNKRDIAGFSLNEVRKLSTDLREINREFYIKDEEMMNLVRRYTEGGLLKDVQDYKTTKEKIKSLTKTVKAGALMLNETYDSIADLLSAFKKAGIDQKDFNRLASDFKVLGSYTGQNASELLRNLFGTVTSGNAGTGYSNEFGLDRIKDITLYTEAWYEQLKNKTNRTVFEEAQKNIIRNLGGPTQASQYLYNAQEQLIESADQFSRAALSFFNYDPSTKQFVFDKNQFKEFLSENKNYNQLIEEYQQKMNWLSENGYQNALLDWQQNSSLYIKNSLKDGDLTKLITKTIRSFAQAEGINDIDLDFSKILGLMGVSDNNMRTLLGGFLQFREQMGDDYGNTMRLQSMWEQINAEKRSKIPSFKEAWSAKWEGIKDKIAKPFMYLKEDFENAFISLNDKWYGYNENDLEKMDKYYTIRSNIKSFDPVEIRKNIEDTSKSIALLGTKISDLTNKGYSVDGSLNNFLRQTLADATKSVVYTRDKISEDSWKYVDKTVAKFKDAITKSAADADISESILAALVKWDQKDLKKKETNENIKSMADKLGKLMFEYGGNKDMALAAFLGGDKTKQDIDNKLKELGYNIDELRKNGQQGLLSSISFEEIASAISNKVKENLNKVKSTDISAPETKKTTVGMLGSAADWIHRKITQDSGLTAEDIDAIISANTSSKPDSIMRGQGKAFYNAAKAAGLDPLFLVSLAAQETSWGTSRFAKERFNFFGIGAFDSNPNNAYSYNNLGLEDALTKQAKWIKENYADRGQDTIHTMFWNNGKHEYSTDKHEKDDPLSEDEKIVKIMYNAMKKIGKQVGALADDKPTSPRINLETIYVSKDKNNKKNEATVEKNYVPAPVSRYGSESFKDTLDLLSLGQVYLMSEEEYKRKRDQLEKEVLKSGDFWERNRANRLWRTYKEAYDMFKDLNDPRVIRALEYHKKRYEDFRNQISGGKYQQLRDFEAMHADALSGKGEQIILRQLGKKFGINEKDFNSVGEYQKALIEAAQNYYNINYEAISNFVAHQFDSSKKLSEGGKKWSSLDVTEKSVTLEELKMLEKMGVIKQGAKGSITNIEVEKPQVVSGKKVLVKSSIDLTKKTDIALGDKDKEILGHLYKTESGSIYYDPYNINKDQKLTTEDLIKWQKNGAIVDYFSGIKSSVNKYGISQIGEGATFDELIKATKTTYENALNASYNVAKQLNSMQNNLDKTGFSDVQYQKVIDAIKNKDIAVLKSVSGELSAEQKTDPDARKAKDSVDSIISLLEKLESLKTDDFAKMVDKLQELKNVASDVGKGAKLFSGLLGESSAGINFNKKIEELAKPLLEGVEALKGQTVSAKQIFDALQNGGNIKDDKGNIVATIDAKTMKTFAEEISQTMTSSIKEQLNSDEGIKNLKTMAATLGDNKLGELLEELVDVKKIREELENQKKTVGEKKEVQQKIEEAQKRQDELMTQITDEFNQVIVDVGKKGEEFGNKTNDALGNFASTFEKYDAAIGKAIDIMNNRISKLDPVYNPSRTSNLSSNTTVGRPTSWGIYSILGVR